MKSGIYKITNTINEKVYVGQSKNLNTRFTNHLYRINRGEHHNEHLQRSFDKHGEDKFVYEILEEIEDLSLLDSREKYWIDHYGGINSNDTYNLKDPLLNEHNDYVRGKISKANSGENNPNYGNKWTDEQKKNMSKSRKGKSWEELYGKDKAKEMRENASESQMGREHSEETKEKIRQANVGEKNPAYGKGDRQLGDKNPMFGKQLSKEHKNKISNKLSGRKLSKEHKNKISESAKKRKNKGFSHSDETKEKIRKANVGENNPAYGKGDRQLGENNPNYGKESSQRKSIIQFDKYGNFIKEYEFLSQVKDDGFHIGNVASAARGDLKSSGGYIWKYKE